MIAIVGLRLNGYLRAYYAVAPAIAGLIVLATLYGGGVTRPEEAYGVSAVVLDGDLADPVQLEALCAEQAELPLGLLVNNAALAHYRPFAELPAAQAQALVELNVLAPVL